MNMKESHALYRSDNDLDKFNEMENSGKYTNEQTDSKRNVQAK